jgi:hypothetical protein
VLRRRTLPPSRSSPKSPWRDLGTIQDLSAGLRILEEDSIDWGDGVEGCEEEQGDGIEGSYED